MLSIRRHATETEFTTMVIAEDPDEGVTAILLEGYAWRYEGHRIVPGPFTELPNDLDRDTVEGIMMWGTGELALGYLGVWIEQLLSGKSILREIRRNSPPAYMWRKIMLILRALTQLPLSLLRKSMSPSTNVPRRHLGL
jgi:hypothetical protein